MNDDVINRANETIARHALQAAEQLLGLIKVLSSTLENDEKTIRALIIAHAAGVLDEDIIAPARIVLAASADIRSLVADLER